MSEYERHKRIIYTDGELRPSAYRVDLRQVLKDREQKKHSEKSDRGFSVVYDCLDELGLVGLVDKLKARIFYRTSRQVVTAGAAWKKPVLSGRLERLAFFSLIKHGVLVVLIFFQALGSLCRWIGWGTVFVVRFAYLGLKAAGKYFLMLTSVLPGYAAKLRSWIKKHQESRFQKSEKIEQDETLEDRLPDMDAGSEFVSPKWISVVWRKHAFKPALIIAALFIVVILPFKTLTGYYGLTNMKGRVLGASEAAISDILGAGKGMAKLDFAAASERFSQASNNFSQARSDIHHISGALSIIKEVIPRDDIKLAGNADAVLAAGELTAKSGQEMSLALEHLDPKNSANNVKEMLLGFKANISQANRYIKDASVELARVDSQTLPEEYQAAFKGLYSRSRDVAGSLDRVEDVLDKAEILLGFEYDKRYLLVFQNNTEMRASGGFIGSYALMDIRNGQIKNLEVPGGGSYDTEGGLYEMIEPPKPLSLLRPLWYFWDANWWPDWPTSARKLMWFLERSSGPTVDGVISLTPTAVERFLEITGPIDMTEQYGIEFTAENFWDETQALAERKPDKTNSPKAVIGDLMNKLLEDLDELLNRDSILSLFETGERNLSEKHILFYFTDQELQSLVEDMGWAGRIRDTDWDYLQVVNSNIGGQKSDKRMKQEIRHTAEIGDDGVIINTVEIIRTHTGSPDEEFAGARNVNWLRMYVPEGSRLISASGFEQPPEKLFEQAPEGARQDPYVAQTEGNARVHKESKTCIYAEQGKTVFANWVQVDPGKSVTARFVYELPFRLVLPEGNGGIMEKAIDFFNPYQARPIPYALLVQKQPGAKTSAFSSRLKLAGGYEQIWQYPARSTNKPVWQISSDLDTDKYWAALVVKKDQVSN